ncbi:Techylectin-5A [Araneus ventricosus]|uniref:Techylectin-5A n=1 Tax=Araneus ventricosus TaxID=182803 RepID=A0A4Y2CXW0_ARAVE|nr:Techylectin-5A [Araneus ventricosus]
MLISVKKEGPTTRSCSKPHQTFTFGEPRTYWWVSVGCGGKTYILSQHFNTRIISVIQRRDDFGTSSDFFYKGWQSYKFGFGDLNFDYWLGNDKIFALSNQRRSTLRFDLWDFEGDDGYATYDNFYIDDEAQGYRLHLGDYRGVIGDSFKGHNLCRFSTRDRDNDNSPYQNCALQYKGGWWYNKCHTVNLNGLYLKGRHDTYADGVNWYAWKGFRYSLRKTEMKVRSSAFLAKPFNRLEAPSTTPEQ